MRADYPILEHDGSESALIEPSEVLRPVDGMPERCVLPIYKQVIDSLHAQSRLTHVTDISSSMGPFPVFKIDHEGHALAVAQPGMCASFVATFLEELIAFGCRKFVACGAQGYSTAPWQGERSSFQMRPSEMKEYRTTTSLPDVRSK